MRATNIPKISWFLSTIGLILAVAPGSAAATSTAMGIDAGEGDRAVVGTNLENRGSSVSCSVQHEGYGGTVGVMHFGLDAGKQSALIAGPTATLFKVEVQSVSGDVPRALITVRGDMNYLRFLESRSSYVERRNGLEGFGTKEIKGAGAQINFGLVSSTGKPGVVVVSCKIDTGDREPAQNLGPERISGVVSNVDFTHVED